MSEDTPTHVDLEAEARVLGTVLGNPNEFADRIADMPTSLFASMPHQAIAEQVKVYVAAGEDFTAEMMMREAPRLAGGGARGDLVRTAIINMFQLANPGSFEYFLDRLIALSRAREIAMTAARLAQRIDSFTEAEELDDALREAQASLDAQESVATGGEEPIRIRELLTNERVEHDWIVPELLERTDRLMVTAAEGAGKSMLLAQVAACLAAGIHPFLFVPIRPVRVLVIDAENSKRQVARRYRKLIGQVEDKCYDYDLGAPRWDDNLGFLIQPEGVHLDEPTTMRLVENMIAYHRPDIVIAGPLYRLHGLDIEKAEHATQLIGMIDRLRVRYQFAFICEAHANHGQNGQQRALRPSGSSVLLRWPEFGVGLRAADGHEDQEHPEQVKVIFWRGGREERIWPRQLQHVFAMAWGPDETYYDRHKSLDVDSWVEHSTPHER
ncbi:DnaB-like dsDNA helicase [Gordonia phage Morgana]|uniref:DnaB-like dsDNA helicase n=1 Tax=Gordonia phage Morgana TaxID=3137292 RepID=A0AAX4RBY2_9CAUD